MMFRELFPNYEAYDEPRFKSVPSGMDGKIRALILTRVAGDKGLQTVCNGAASFALCEPTTNWGRDYLADDLRNYMDKLVEGKFHAFMDFVAWFANKLLPDSSLLPQLNDLFESSEFGYRLTEELGPKALWVQVKEPTETTTVIEESISVVENVVDQARRHLAQAKEHIKKADDDRAMKDAVRDCMSAMESVVKHVTGEKDFDDGCGRLKDLFGLYPEIAKEPKRIWDIIHKLYPDVRHGAAVSDIGRYEPGTWVTD